MSQPIRKQHRQLVPFGELEIAIKELRRHFDCNNADALRLIGYSGGTGWADWRRYGAPAVALNAAKAILNDLRGSTMLRPPGTPAPELPLTAPPAPATNGVDHPPGLLTVAEPEPEARALLLEHDEPPEPLFTFDELEALFALLHTRGGQLPTEETRRCLLRKVAQLMAAT